MANRYTEQCHLCDGVARPASIRKTFRFGARTIDVDVDAMQCEACQEVFYLPGQMDDAQLKAASSVRRQEGLLTPAAIRGIRERYGYTQADFERLLGVGPKTVVRWERGTVFQNRATDVLLRVLDELPEAAAALARRHGVHAPVSAPGLAVDELFGWAEQFISFAGDIPSAVVPELPQQSTTVISLHEFFETKGRNASRLTLSEDDNLIDDRTTFFAARR